MNFVKSCINWKKNGGNTPWYVRSILILYLLCTVSVAEVPGAPSGTEHAGKSVSETDQPLLFANYYIWYRDNQPAGEGWGQWTKNKTGTFLEKGAIDRIGQEGDPPIASQAYPLAGLYDSGDREVARWHMRLAQQAGIDAFLVSWWGDVKGRKETFESTVLPMAEELGFPVALFDERAQFHNDFDAYKKRVVRFLDRYRTSSAYLHIDGQPVIYLYQIAHRPKLSVDQVRELVTYVEERVGPVYWILDKIDHNGRADALGRSDRIKHIPSSWLEISGIDSFGFYSTFSNFRAHRHEEIAGKYRFLAGQARKAGKKMLLPVHPGHDNRRFRSSDSAYHMPRRNGQTLKDFLRAAAEAPADFVMVTSFNEWPETTIVEPSSSWSDPYRHLRILADWKGVEFQIPGPPPE